MKSNTQTSVFVVLVLLIIAAALFGMAYTLNLVESSVNADVILKATLAVIIISAGALLTILPGRRD